MDERNGRELVCCLENNYDDHSASIASMLELDETDRIILKVLIEYPGIKMSAVARMFGVRENFIRNRAKKPAFRLAHQKLTSTTDDLMIVAAKKAAIKLIDLIDHPNPIIALGATKVALSRFLSQTTNPEDEQAISYETNIEVDGQLLQHVIRKEMRERSIDV